MYFNKTKADVMRSTKMIMSLVSKQERCKKTTRRVSAKGMERVGGTSSSLSFIVGAGGLRKLGGNRRICSRKRGGIAVKCCERTAAFEKTTVAWVRQVVVGLHLCPFAEAVMQSDKLRIVVSEGRTAGQVRKSVMDEIDYLIKVSEEEVQTTLVVTPEFGHEDFVGFGEFCRGIEEEVEKNERLMDEISVAWFHPEFEWGDANMDEAVHFDKRAPYPTINLLRVEELDRYIEQGRTQHILDANQKTLRRVGVERMKEMYRNLVE